ncbi:MAG TPA: fused MFS/spermidine synthase [Kineosporiaceae bacterium]|nr:fused MFS/spermidine synthase [Kineosporiaceae bacterium]
MDTGRADLLPDDDSRRRWTLVVNGVPSSHVDLDDPTRLDFEYVRWFGDVLDLVAPEGTPLRVVHLGGAGCTVARYVAATRPRSRQIVFEIDAGLLGLTRRAFGLRSSPALRLVVADARAGLAGLPAGGQDVVVRDAFSGASVPSHLTTGEFLDEVRRVLVPGGLYLANLADSPRLELARREAATALGSFAEVALVAEPGHLHGRRYGNVVLAGSDTDLPWGRLERRLASGAVRARMLTTGEVRSFASGYRALHDRPPLP